MPKLIPPIGPQDLSVGNQAVDVDTAAFNNPLDYLDSLMDEGVITQSQRDAGEILRRMGQSAISTKSHSDTVTFPWRYANGVWSTLFEPKRLVIDRYEQALEAAGNNERRRDLVRALVAREPDYPTSPTLVAEGLHQIALHWWGKAAVRAVGKYGVTLAATPANDNTPTPERIKQAGDVVQTAEATRVRDNFERLLVRGQIDDDRETAGALYAAGVRFQSEYQLAQLVPYGSPDYSKPIVDGGGSEATPITERAQSARHSLRMARNAMGRRYAEIVEAVAVHGLTLEAAGRRYCGYRGVKQAQAAAKERLNGGLRALGCFYGITIRRAA